MNKILKWFGTGTTIEQDFPNHWKFSDSVEWEMLAKRWFHNQGWDYYSTFVGK